MRSSLLAARRSPLATRRSRPGPVTNAARQLATRSPSLCADHKYLPPALLERRDCRGALSLILVQVAAVHTIRRASFPRGLQRLN